MVLNQENKMELESLGSLLLDMAQERSVETLLKTAAQRLTERPYTARIRIWLMKQGDICPSCTMRVPCHDKKYCLHLITSTAGLAAGVTTPGDCWTPSGNIWKSAGVHLRSFAPAFTMLDAREEGGRLAARGGGGCAVSCG